MILHLAIFTILLEGGVLTAGYEGNVHSEFGRVITPIRRKRKVYQHSSQEGESHEHVYTSVVHDSKSLDFILFRNLFESYSFSYDQSLYFSFSYSYGSASNPSATDKPVGQPKSSPNIGVRNNDMSEIFLPFPPFPFPPPESQTESNTGTTSSTGGSHTIIFNYNDGTRSFDESPPESQTESNTGTTSSTGGPHTIIIDYDDGTQSFDESIILPTIIPVDTDQNVVTRNPSQPGTPPQTGEGTLFLTCDNDGEVSSKRIDSTSGPPLSNTPSVISYTYSVTSETEEIRNIYALETEIFNTLASSLLDCNGGDDRGLVQHEQRLNQRALTQIHALERTASAGTINVLGQCGEEENENAYCFTVETTTYLLIMEGEDDGSSIRDAAMDALRDVHEAMNDGSYVGAIPPLKKVTLLRSDPDIFGPSTALGDTAFFPPKTSSISLEPEKQQKKSNNIVAVLSTSALAVMGVGVALLALFTARRRRHRYDRHAELVDVEIDRVPSSLTSESYKSQEEQLEINRSHIHPISESSESSNIDWDFSFVARQEVSTLSSHSSSV